MSAPVLPQNGERARFFIAVYRSVVIAGILGLCAWVWDSNATIATLVVKVDTVKEGLNKIEDRLYRLERPGRGWDGQP